MNKLNLALVLGLVACGSSEAPTAQVEKLPTLNVETAQLQAETYIKNLFPGTEVNGPVCMPEAVVDQYTQCSYSMRSGESWQVGTLLCSNLGCREGEAPTVVAADVAPPVQASSGHGGMDNDWLFYYMLLNSGAVHGPYSVWYSSTPAVYRSAYYGVGYRPTIESRTYYTRTYSAPIRSTSTQRFSSVTTGRPGVTRTTTPTTSRTTPATSTPRTTTPSTRSSAPTTSTPRTTTPSTRSTPAPAPRAAPAPRPAPSRSSGFRAPSRSRR